MQPTVTPALPTGLAAQAHRRTSGNPALCQPAPPRRNTDPLRPKFDLILKQFFSVLEELRAESEDVNAFRFDLDEEAANTLAAKFAAAREKEATERRRVIDATYEQLSKSMHDVLEQLVSRVAGEQVAPLWATVESLKSTVEQLAKQPPSSSAPDTTPLAAPTPIRTDAALLARVADLEDTQRRRDREFPSVTSELATLKARLSTLEAAGKQSSDPRVRPGSRAGSGSGSRAPSPTLAQSLQPFAPKSELDALKGDVARLARRVDGGDATALGKRPTADGPTAGEEGPAAKAPRLGASAEAFELLGARVEVVEQLGARVEAVEQLGPRVKAVVDKLTAVGDKVEQAAQDTSEDMDLESNPTQGATGSAGLEKLEKRLDDLRSELGAELDPVKESVTALEKRTASLSDTHDTLSSRVDAVGLHAGSILNQVGALTRQTTLPPPDSPHHPEQLHAALTALSERVSSQLTAAQRALFERDVLDALCARASTSGGRASPTPSGEALGAQMSAKMRAWDGASAQLNQLAGNLGELEGKHDKLAGQFTAYVALADDKLSSVAELAAFLQESVFPELKQISHLIDSWREQRILPEAAWELLDNPVQDDDDEDDGDGDDGPQGASNGAQGGANGLAAANGAAPAGG